MTSSPKFIGFVHLLKEIISENFTQIRSNPGELSRVLCDHSPIRHDIGKEKKTNLPIFVKCVGFDGFLDSGPHIMIFVHVIY